jgi:hypothetical protein
MAVEAILAMQLVAAREELALVSAVNEAAASGRDRSEAEAELAMERAAEKRWLRSQGVYDGGAVDDDEEDFDD